MAKALREQYVYALDADTEARKAAAVLPLGQDGISRIELRMMKEASHNKLQQARRQYWAHVDMHGCVEISRNVPSEHKAVRKRGRLETRPRN